MNFHQVWTQSIQITKNNLKYLVVFSRRLEVMFSMLTNKNHNQHIRALSKGMLLYPIAFITATVDGSYTVKCILTKINKTH